MLQMKSGKMVTVKLMYSLLCNVACKRNKTVIRLYVIFAPYAGRDRINGTVRVLFKTRLIFSRINGPIELEAPVLH